MTRASIANALFKEMNEERGVAISVGESAELVEGILRIIKETLQKGEEVKIPGFGTFTTHRKLARKGRNPKTGEAAEVAPRLVIRFQASQLLQNSILQPAPLSHDRHNGNGRGTSL